MNEMATNRFDQTRHFEVFDIESIIHTKSELKILVEKAAAFACHEAFDRFPPGSIERTKKGFAKTKGAYSFFEAVEFMYFCWLTNFLPAHQALSVAHHFTTIVAEEIDREQGDHSEHIVIT